MSNPNSKWYPYIKVQEGFSDHTELDPIPRKIMDYLLDMPDKDYEPKDDNDYPRCRFWKYLYYDGARPLDNKLPTPKQKKEVLFNPDKPEQPPTEKGYRLIPQIYTKPAQENAQTRVYVYLGRGVAENDFTTPFSVVFDIWTHYTQESNTKAEAYSRTLAISDALFQAFHGVNMAGVGTFFFNRSKHPDCGEDFTFDKDSNVRRMLVLGLELDSTTLNGNEEDNEVSIGDGIYAG